MPTFQYNENSLSFWTESSFDDYSTVSRSSTQYIVQAQPTYNPDWMAYQIVFSLTGGTSYYNPEADKVIFTGGTITGVTYLNAAGDTLASVTGLNADATMAFGQMLNSNPAQTSPYFWDFVLQNHSGGLYIGSDETGEKDLPYASQIDEMDRGDDIATSRGNDTVEAGGGSDWISDYGGADQYDGQAGVMDTVSYNSWRHLNFFGQTGIVADLYTGQIVGPDGHTDTVVNIEAVYGTRFADVLRGSAVANTFIGGAGSDVMNGRGGMDTAFYYWDQVGGIVANMAIGVVTDGWGGRDRLTSIEKIVGTTIRDRFIDGDGNQSYDGREGNDLFSLAGGNDTVRGGAGADVFTFLGTDFGTDRILDYRQIEDDYIRLSGADSMAELTISVSGADKVIALGTSQIVLVGRASIVLDSSDFVFI